MQAMNRSKAAWSAGVLACLFGAAACTTGRTNTEGSFGTATGPAPGGTSAPSKSSSGSKSGPATGNGATSSAGGTAPTATAAGGAVSTAPTPTSTPAPMSPLAGVKAAAPFNYGASLTAFQNTAYSVLQQNCANCHSEAGGQLPYVASSTPAVAHMTTLTKVDLRDVANSKIVTRLSVEAHNCWSDCTQNAQTLQQALQSWADAISPLPVATVPTPSGQVTDAQVSSWIAADRATLSSDNASYAAYTSLHTLYNNGASLDELNTARLGLSKALNSTARYAPSIVNPVPIDPYGLVYRFDIRDYWGYWTANPYLPVTGAGTPDSSHAQTAWSRIQQGNINGDFSLGDKPSTFPNIAGFHSDYVEASQLVYTLTRPDVYNEIMNIPGISSPLETQLGVDTSKGADSFQYMTVDKPITLSPRMLMRQSIGNGYFWKSTDPFAGTTMVWYERPIPEFNQSGGPDMVKSTPLSYGNGPGGYSWSGQVTLNDAGTGLQDGLQAEASEIIFSLPNGLQGYMIGGAGDEQRVDAFTFVVVDPRRGGPKQQASVTPRPTADPTQQQWRLLEAASCFGCHDDGMNRAPDGMQNFLANNPTKWDPATVARVKQLYPGTAAMGQQLEQDRALFAAAINKVADGTVLGLASGFAGIPTADQTTAIEPVMFMFEKAQALYGYTNSISN